jgi:hypothetical protein
MRVYAKCSIKWFLYPPDPCKTPKSQTLQSFQPLREVFRKTIKENKKYLLLSNSGKKEYIEKKRLEHRA